MPSSTQLANEHARKYSFLEHVRRVHNGIYEAVPDGEEHKQHLAKEKAARLSLENLLGISECPCCHCNVLGFDQLLDHIVQRMQAG